MDFVVFDKLSELETKVYLLEQELQEKDATITTLSARIRELEGCINKSSTSNETVVNLDLCSLEPGTVFCLFQLTKLGKSVAEILKETSESVLRSTAYAFDKRTGLYFDNNSGYYYDPKNKLFYEPRTGTYYRYNAETREYVHQTSIDKVLAAQFKHLTQEHRVFLESERSETKSTEIVNHDSQQSDSSDRRHERVPRHGTDKRRSMSRSSGHRSQSTSSPDRPKRSHWRRERKRRRNRSTSDRSPADSRSHRKRWHNRRSLSKSHNDNRSPSLGK
ncbi:Angiogenic factor with G patch and FHA domains 1 [Fasciola hepatica]|uniref:Angiogenic factor with G patch and FHA domains 1 n=1 Tax=Fasciola hepatica TaxID=6192 RepID=A0A4E0QZU4_FASHE|nr:Angiogenic factor with G patch and FHA domains 1 [Fasciola hepatica]